MSSFRGHRVVIASLFLPDTIAHESSLEGFGRRPSALNDVEAKTKLALGSNLTGGLKSIVEDLKVKSARNPTPATNIPIIESQNPFAGVVLPNASSTNQERLSKESIRRRQSRSSSARRRSSFGDGPNRTDSLRRDAWFLEPNSHCNGGLKNAIDSLAPKIKNKLWVGTLGCPVDSILPSQRNAVTSKLFSQFLHPSFPVWVPDAEFNSCYDEFCHQVLWPCLHYAIPDAPRTKTFYESASYSQYVAVNQKFADAIIANHQDGDLIWVNDYHLMLLPALLRSSGKIPPSTPIGFFMHVAFPSSEIFRCLSVRHDLLRGVLGADLVGFQTANYARHFRATVSRIMAYEALPKGIQVADGDGAAGEDHVKAVSQDGKQARGRFVDVGVFPVGIDVWQLKEKKADPEVSDWIQLLTQRYAGMKLFVGRDKLDEVQGVRHKIRAFEYFLDKHPEYQGKAILIQIALPTTGTSHTHSPESNAVTDAISRINSRFSSLTYQPVIFLHTQDITFSQYLALLSVADAFVVASLREGMALRSHEFVECQEGRYRPLILSEFTGSYSYSGFRSCIAINPWDTRSTADAMYQALDMSEEEAQMRWEDLHNHVTTQTAQAFVTSFLNRTLRAHAENRSATNDGNVNTVPIFDPVRIQPRYRHSRRRLILLDFEGTLWVRDLSRIGLVKMEEDYADVGTPKAEDEDTKPVDLNTHGEVSNPRVRVPSDVIRLLEKLTEDRRNEVWLLSGLRMKGLLQRIADRIPKLGIVAENGCFIKTIAKTRPPHYRSSSMSSITYSPPGSPTYASSQFTPQSPTGPGGPKNNKMTQGGEWINMVQNVNFTWKTPCLEILSYFTERTPGSFIEERDASVVWRFWTGVGPAGPDGTDNADRQWARRQAAEAQNHIFDSLGERYGLRIIPGKNSFLVLANNVSRGTAVGAILHPGGPARSPISRSWMSPDLLEAHSGYGGSGWGWGGSGIDSGAGEEIDFALVVSGDEKLVRRMNELEGSETCSTSGRGTDAKWKLESGSHVDEEGKSPVVKALWALVGGA